MPNSEREHCIYVVFSQTHTRYGRVIRRIAKQKYNHASVSLDSSLEQLYAFGRPQHGAVLLGCLVRESLERYTLRKIDRAVPVAICRIPVREEEYKWISNRINAVLEDEEYVYNLFSVLTFPFFGGFAIYKAFTCVEFVAHLMRYLKYTSKPSCKYTPDELLYNLEDKKIFEGDIQKYESKLPDTSMYFKPIGLSGYKRSLKIIGVLIKRSLLNRIHEV